MISTPNPAIVGRFAQPGETWASLVRRVASVGDQRSRATYRELVGRGLLVPGGQILRGAGRPGAVLYNCFVTGASADEGAADLAARMTRWTRLGAGVGVNLDELAARERDAGGSACEVIDAIARSQHSLWREGVTRTATMVTLSLGDPEIVAASRLLTSAEHYRHLNLGVLVTDADLTAGSPVLGELAEVAWATGNPGFLFIDRVRCDHPFPDVIRACNPCAEQFLADEEGCNLASLNLAAFVSGADVDWDAFDQAAHVAVRFLDDVIDASAFPSKASAAMAARRRRIGLGVLGFASALHLLGVEYGSAASVSLAEQFASRLRLAAQRASAELASERGPFPDATGDALRNSHLLSIAPTGAISLLWRTSSGIEPVFGDVIEKGGIRVDLGTAGAERPLRGAEVAAAGHVAVLAAWQQHVDGGISKTVNMPERSTVAAVENVLRLAHSAGCKGLSVFRDNSRPAAVTPVRAEAA